MFLANSNAYNLISSCILLHCLVQRSYKYHGTIGISESINIAKTFRNFVNKKKIREKKLAIVCLELVIVMAQHRTFNNAAVFIVITFVKYQIWIFMNVTTIAIVRY